MKTKLISKIYRTIQAKNNCMKINNLEWAEKHENVLNEISKNYLPHGSGIDAECEIDIEKSNENKIVINFEFHHLNENGYYDGWSNHKCICKPSFDTFYMQITGINRRQIKDYLFDLFYNCLNEEIEFLPFF